MPPSPQPEAESNLRAAERVVSLLAEHGVSAVVIGAVALAAHRYVRHTEDIDLGVDADLPTLPVARIEFDPGGAGLKFFRVRAPHGKRGSTTAT